jgi:hypothetical protein
MCTPSSDVGVPSALVVAWRHPQQATMTNATQDKPPQGLMVSKIVGLSQVVWQVLLGLRLLVGGHDHTGPHIQ